MSEHLLHNHSLVMEIFMRHPIVGSVTAVTLSAGGYFMPHLIEVQLPLIAMQLIQIGVWCLAGVASILTIVGYFKKHK